jgi:hypothetical protein
MYLLQNILSDWYYCIVITPYSNTVLMACITDMSEAKRNCNFAWFNYLFADKNVNFIAWSEYFRDVNLALFYPE